VRAVFLNRLSAIERACVYGLSIETFKNVTFVPPFYRHVFGLTMGTEVSKRMPVSVMGFLK
jgi:hypothetical protein